MAYFPFFLKIAVHLSVFLLIAVMWCSCICTYTTQLQRLCSSHRVLLLQILARDQYEWSFLWWRCLCSNMILQLTFTHSLTSTVGVVHTHLCYWAVVMSRLTPDYFWFASSLTDLLYWSVVLICVFVAPPSTSTWMRWRFYCRGSVEGSEKQSKYTRFVWRPDPI